MLDVLKKERYEDKHGDLWTIFKLAGRLGVAWAIGRHIDGKEDDYVLPFLPSRKACINEIKRSVE